MIYPVEGIFMKRVMNEFKTFFESYEVTNALMDIKNIKVHIFEAKSKPLLNIRMVEVQINPHIIGNKRVEKNTFADIKIEGNKVTMMFKVVDVNSELKNTVSKAAKNDHAIKFVGNHLTVIATNPVVDEISKLFMAIEPYCRKYKSGSL
jgi:lysyl-tRNA synthetase class II